MPNKPRKDTNRPGGAKGVAWAAKRAAEAPPPKPTGGQGVRKATVSLPRLASLEEPGEE